MLSNSQIIIVVMLLVVVVGIIAIIVCWKTGKFDKFSGILSDNGEEIDITLNEQVVSPTIEETVMENENMYYETATDPNYNTVNDLPYIINPDNADEGYYYTKPKIITNPNSPLLQKENEIKEKINVCKSCTNVVEIDDNIQGYNAYANLKNTSPANITSIGKSLLTPYVSFPVPS